MLESVLPGWDNYRDPNAAKFDERYAVALPSGVDLRFGQRYEVEAMDMSRPVNQAGYEISRAAFEGAQELVATWGGQLIVLLVPTREEVYAAQTASLLGDELDAIRSARLAMLDLCAELQLACFDALGGLQERATAGELLYYADDLHLNPLGNQVFAGLLREWLADNGFLAG